MAWIYLVVAGLLEIAWAIGLKGAGGWTKLWPSLWTAVTMILSFFFLSRALQTLPVGTAYAVWTGIGAVGTAIIGMWWFGEPRNAIRIACLVVIVIGIAGLKITAE